MAGELTAASLLMCLYTAASSLLASKCFIIATPCQGAALCGLCRGLKASKEPQNGLLLVARRVRARPLAAAACFGCTVLRILL